MHGYNQSMKHFAVPVIVPSVLLLLSGLALRANSPARLMVVSPDTAHYDFGMRECGDSSPLTHTFRLRNSGTLPVTVVRVPTSCHCTEAVPEGGKTLPLTLTPGATLPLVVTVDPNRFGPGPVSKTVWVYVRGEAAPNLTLEVTGTLRAVAAP